MAPVQQRRRKSRQRCLVCGIHAGNTAFVRIRTFTLIYGVREQGGGKTTRSAGQIGLCDRCIREQGIGPERALSA